MEFLSGSLDLKAGKETLSADLAAAMQAGDENRTAEAMVKYASYIHDSILAEAVSLSSEQARDTAVLASRGVRQLTSEENRFYMSLIDAFGSPNPRMALSELDVTLPETTINAVFDEMTQAHPLLDAINFTNTTAMTKILVNKGGIQLAKWGKLTSAFTQELEGSFGEIDVTLMSLKAFLPVAKDMLLLGPAWLDRYVRTVIAEAVAYGVENAVITGDGSESPVGMDRVVGKDANVQGGKYTKKTAEKVTSFSTKEYGALASKLAVNSETEIERPVTELILVVNPVDYLTTIMPATTVITPMGTYVGNVFPIPTRVIQSHCMTKGEAVLGIGKRYFMGLGAAKKGTIEYDDSVKFMEDQRVYAGRFYGNGMPLDNNAFLLLDISEVSPARYPVSTYAESRDDAP